jgi:hypothetical protein
MELPADAPGQRITEALVHLDDTIREIRNTAFTALDHDTAISTCTAQRRQVTPPRA